MGRIKSVLSVALAGGLLLISTIIISSCGDDERHNCDLCWPYLPQTSPENVLKNLELSIRARDIQHYSDLLATDFRFYFDELTRLQNGYLPEFWTASMDSAATDCLFDAMGVTDIRILLQFGVPRPVDEAGKTDWKYIDVPDTFLEIDLAPQPGETEGLTLRVDGQQQRFYFRKGRTPEDTDSETWYLVEWRDYGMLRKLNGPVSRLQVEPNTWGALKALCR